MDSNVSPIVPRPIVVPARDQHGRKKQGQDGSPAFDLNHAESPESVPEGHAAERHSEGDLPVGHAERDEVGRRIDVTG
tara:strand:+ start:5322 stop:5555 length:234 start_codon:yes stop_codon:yes gene_type:complete